MRYKKFIIKTAPEDLFEFANLTQNQTGITNIVIHAYAQGEVQVNHGPRIKVSNVYSKFRTNDCFVIDIKNSKVVEGEVKISSKELKLVKLWIAANKKELIEYWTNGAEMNIDDFLSSLSKINENEYQ
jgi:hypothetical protein